MSQGKAQKPTLTGTRNKTRKRDEKERFEPAVFRDAIITGLEEVGNNHELINKYLCETATAKLDVKRYGEILLDVLFVGGIISAGGAIEGGVRTDICLARQELSDVKSFVTEIFIKFIRRFKWLQKTLGEEINKIIMVMKVCLDDRERELVGAAAAYLMIEGVIPPTILSRLTQDHLLKDDISASFATSLFRTWLHEKDMTSLSSTLKKASLDPTLQDLFPVGPKRELDRIESYFAEQGLNEMVQHVRAQRASNNRKVFGSRVKLYITDDEYNNTELQEYIEETMNGGKVTPIYALQVLFSAIAGSGMWAGQDTISDDFYKELKQYTSVFAAVAKSTKLQIDFTNKIQEFCYDNINFLKTFQKIIFMFYNEDVLAEEAIVEWYKHAHSVKGKTEFLSQTEKFVEWLENAEEEESDEEKE